MQFQLNIPRSEKQSGLRGNSKLGGTSRLILYKLDPPPLKYYNCKNLPERPAE